MVVHHLVTQCFQLFKWDGSVKKAQLYTSALVPSGITLLNLHFTSGAVQCPQELSLAEPVVASDKSSWSHHPVPHLLKGVQDVIARSRELHLAALLVLVIRQRCRLLWQDSELIQGESIHCATVDVTWRQEIYFGTVTSLIENTLLMYQVDIRFLGGCDGSNLFVILSRLWIGNRSNGGG